MKPTFIISCPIDTYSGYGARSRDLVKAIIELNKYDVKILPQRWGNTPWFFLKNNEKEWGFLKNYLFDKPHLNEQPDIWAQVTIPNEFQPLGKFNIGFTAGIESTVCAADWIGGLNRMDVNFVSSEHSKKVFEESFFEELDKENKKTNKVIKLSKPVEVLFEGVNLNTYKSVESPNESLTAFEEVTAIEEDFGYLFVGNWLNGDVGEDRKNVGLLIKLFYETFKDKKNKPFLILKTFIVGSSHIDKYEIIKKIESIKKEFKSSNLPNIYLLHGELSDEEMNLLYNHPKIKAMVSLTKGEGFGRPLLEFGLIGKPIITTEWSGHLDFLDKKYTILLPGKLTNISEKVSNDWLIKESKWFSVDEHQVINSLKDLFENYEDYLFFAEKQKEVLKSNFSLEKMAVTLDKKITSFLDKKPKEIKYED